MPHLPAESADPGANPFEVCRLGILWRVILGVQVAVAVGSLFGASGWQAALIRWAQGAAVALPATLLWLLLVCGLAGWLGRLSGWLQVWLASLLGAAVAVVGRWQSMWIERALDPVPVSWWYWVPAASAGLLMAGAVTLVLRQRASKILPADAQARLAELQARIRPHFLFNTLNTAIALVQVDPKRAEAVLEDLAELFREALASPHARSTLAQELDLARRYLSIEALRFGERLSVTWEVAEATLTTALPALTLQPLVENAVRHGVETCASGGWVRVEALADAGRLILTVTNSVPAEEPEGPSTGQGMALRNVRQRLRLMYDVEADFSAQRQPDARSETAWVFVARLVAPLPEGVL